MTMITPSYLGETIEYSSLHACRSTLEDPTGTAPASDLGKLSRIIFADGATVVGHVIDLHRAADGTVLSVEFFHRDGGGREVIPIDRIARIEDAP